MFLNSYAGKRVFVTGHTGFKGSWLCTWLISLGADVAGYSLGMPSEPSNFEVLRLEQKMHSFTGDVRDLERLKKVFYEFQPEFVFHLAAQSLVRRSYIDPVATFEVNAMGTLNILECIRHTSSVRAGVIITSDKCYRNVEWVWGYRENDILGGDDPYSGSKGCAELISHSYMHSYFNDNESGVAIATARAGNVIGGGDWAEDRIVPDCVRSWSKGETVTIRNPHATRPWQHVLEPLSGYLWLGSKLWKRNSKAARNSFNFGPDATVNESVETLIRLIGKYWTDAKWIVDDRASEGRPEATLLRLSCDKALTELEWKATLSFTDTVRLTSQWYQQYYDHNKTDLFEFSLGQIDEYCRLATKMGLSWSTI